MDKVLEIPNSILGQIMMAQINEIVKRVSMPVAAELGWPPWWLAGVLTA